MPKGEVADATMLVGGILRLDGRQGTVEIAVSDRKGE